MSAEPRLASASGLPLPHHSSTAFTSSSARSANTAALSPNVLGGAVTTQSTERQTHEQLAQLPAKAGTDIRDLGGEREASWANATPNANGNETSVIPESAMRAIEELEARLTDSETARQERERWTWFVMDQWIQVDVYLDQLEDRVREARRRFTRALQEGVPVSLSPPQLYTHPPIHSQGLRRPRSPDFGNYPPSKRSRGNDGHVRALGAQFSESRQHLVDHHKGRASPSTALIDVDEMPLQPPGPQLQTNRHFSIGHQPMGLDSASRSVMRQGSLRVGGRTHIFVAPVTAAKYGRTYAPSVPNARAALTSSSCAGGATTANSALSGNFPAKNEQGQRICRECGQEGRYKDGKCVEKWGPGPAGPGTVCDRCRKRMKRVQSRPAHAVTRFASVQLPSLSPPVDDDGTDLVDISHEHGHARTSDREADAPTERKREQATLNLGSQGGRSSAQAAGASACLTVTHNNGKDDSKMQIDDAVSGESDTDVDAEGDAEGEEDEESIGVLANATLPSKRSGGGATAVAGEEDIDDLAGRDESGLRDDAEDAAECRLSEA